MKTNPYQEHQSPQMVRTQIMLLMRKKIDTIFELKTLTDKGVNRYTVIKDKFEKTSEVLQALTLLKEEAIQQGYDEEILWIYSEIMLKLSKAVSLDDESEKDSLYAILDVLSESL